MSPGLIIFHFVLSAPLFPILIFLFFIKNLKMLSTVFFLSTDIFMARWDCGFLAVAEEPFHFSGKNTANAEQIPHPLFLQLKKHKKRTRENLTRDIFRAHE